MSHEKISSLISDNSRIDGEEDQIDRSSSTLYYKDDNDKSSYNHQNNADNEELGPLPPKWEKAMTENGEVYFIDHSSGTSHWLDPRLSKFQKKSLEDCLDDELPYGWEKISDPQYGTYFIDHVNRRTQYENPVIQAKRAAERGLNACSGRASFTRDPSELCGQRFTTALLKSSRGLGFTIVGGDDDVDEFLQIKSVVPNGPAWLDGKLQTGDLIVYVNDTCVLGYTHNQIVHLFQSIAPGETVVLEVCRGYSLPFDPNDPNTEVVTTIAVDGNIENAESEKVIMDLNRDLSADRNFNFLDTGLNQSEELLKDSNCNVNSLMNSTDGVNSAMKELSISSSMIKNVVNISIVKGTLGFGFTIADSACGQRVKKILDRQRCKNLLEGDILMEINSISVQEMSHDDVVQVLKNCPYNEEAVICVQRGPVNTKANPNKNKNRKMENGRFSKDLSGPYRSKTPTADLYSTQQKEVLPSRPKTPLVDTRIRIKTPLGDVSAANSTTSSKSLRREEVSGLFNYDGLSESSPYQLADNPGLSCSQTDISVNLNEHACKPLYGNYDSSIYGRYNVHIDTCFCYECKQMKMRPVNDFRAMHIDTNTYDGSEYVNRNLDRRKDMNMIGYDYRDPSRQLDNWQWISQNGQCQMNGEYVDCLVTLVRQETGFGFRIVGGTEEGSQVAVGHVVPGGAADLDGRINTGDEILSVDGHSVLKASHHQVVQLMGGAAARGRVTLRIRRRLHHLPIQHAPTYDVVVHRSENEGFGFVIISSVNKVGSTIGRLIEGSPAERCGQLHVGDHIVAVNHIDITNLCHGDIVNLIKDSGYSVTLTIGPPLSDLS